jgi:pimeloyl-ACP methyl ester carboxylesterase
MLGSPFNVAAKFASHGLATIAINLAIHGFGRTSTLTVTRSAANGGPVTFLSGGRSFDANSDGLIAADEGYQAGGSKSILQSRHGGRQTVADLMQLIREIQVGVDADGDGIRDLDPSRIYYAGTSTGATIGVLLFAVHPDVRAATLTGIGGRAEPALSPLSRSGVGQYLATRIPSLINPPGTTLVKNLGGVDVGSPFFNETQIERDRPPLVNTVAGAVAIQGVLERATWVGNVGGAPFAPHLRLAPLPGLTARPFLVQESRGDQNVTNPGTANFVRAGAVADRVTLYRHDKLKNRADFKNPHSFLIRTDKGAGDVNGVMIPVALLAQEQVATFLASDGQSVIDPDGDGVPGELFEVPAREIPEDYGFILN